MENIENLTFHYTITGIAIFIFQLLVIAASIIIIIKYKKSIGAKIILVGTLLTLLSIILSQIGPLILDHPSDEEFFKNQIIITYLNTISFFVFTIGFFLFAVKDLKHENNNI
ncbi:hypothetical protein RM697_02505 [Ichthyenterobacterium sp. W332]|uniref:Uncharacterized protein n=1 Tax=Microcosmobacter mediterraneus TaxID=3075607 RepID=A0ABU2YHK3_9FLAO|nr:hypothetical protein [Ichthyenterobacterium sp. W332]MDT0557502.1 hypothetical protein [Ichthyenterobacterium sp. W332]